MFSDTSTSSHQPAYVTDPVKLPGLLQQLVADLADPTISYLLGGHYYERTNHSRTRHFPAVSTLQQDEVRNVEVGADFVAFDTQFVRYSEWGESGYPAALPDQFRATVPFTQLYQLCRKVLTPTEQTTAEVSYGPETIIYYNEVVHRHYPTPANINLAYAAAPATGEHPLGAVFAVVEAGLADPVNHYSVNTTAFESPAGPVLLGMLHLQTHTARNLVIGEQGFTCSVLFNPNDRQEWSSVHVAFDQVWQVLHSDRPQMDLEEIEAAGGLLYDAPEVLSAYVRQRRTT